MSLQFSTENTGIGLQSRNPAAGPTVGQARKTPQLWPKFTINFCSWASHCNHGHSSWGKRTRATAAATSGAAGASLLLPLAAAARHPRHAGRGPGTASPPPSRASLGKGSTTVNCIFNVRISSSVLLRKCYRLEET